MAKKDQEEGQIDVGQVYSKSEDFVNNNGRNIVLILVALLLAIAAWFGYKNFIVKPKIAEAKEQMWKAEYYFGIDSLNLALTGNIDEGHLGFRDIADNYGSTPSGDLAKHYSGVILLQQGNFDEAISYLKDCSFPTNVIIESQRLGSIGDAYVELGDVSSGVDYFQKSVSQASNTATTPIYLKKLGLALESLGKNDEALKAYEQIKTEFANSTEGRTIDKYIARLGGE